MTIRTATCACGALSVRAEGEPARLSICHCNECKRRTGSAFSWNATFPAERIAISGESGSWTRSSEDGFWVRNHFCPTCGVNLFFEIERRPGLVSIPAGGFGDPDFPPPTVQVYDEIACTWLPPLGLPSG